MPGELIRNSVNWDRGLEQGLPDCRRADGRPVVMGRLAWDKVYCANCGADGGYVTADWCAHIFYICDDCVKYAPKELRAVEVPEAIVRGQGDG